MVSAVSDSAKSRRDTILEAALQCFLDSTVSATTVDQIRTRSGASIGSIYHFFGSKDGIAAQLYVETLAAYHEVYLDALRTSTSAREGIMASVRCHLRWVADNPDRARYLFHWREPEVTDRRDGSVAALNDRFYSEATEWLEGHVRAGRIRSLSPRLFQSLWMGATLEYARLWLARSTGEPDLIDAEETLALAAWEAVRAT